MSAELMHKNIYLDCTVRYVSSNELNTIPILDNRDQHDEQHTASYEQFKLGNLGR